MRHGIVLCQNLTITYVLLGVLTLVFGVIFMNTGGSETTQLLGAAGVVLGILELVFAYGLRSFAKWTPILGWILAVPLLLSIPIGTLVGIFTIKLLVQKAHYFRGDTRPRA